MVWAASFSAGFLSCKIYFSFTDILELDLEKNLLLNIFFAILSLLISISIFIKTARPTVKKSGSSFGKMVIISSIVFLFSGYICFSSFILSENKGYYQLLNVFFEKNEMQKIEVQGRIASHTKSYRKNVTFLFYTDFIVIPGKGEQLKRPIKPGETIKVKVNTDFPNVFQRDDFLRFECTLLQDSGGFILHAVNDDIEKIAPYDAKGSIFKLRQRFYKSIRNIFYEGLKYNNASFCEAVILGNQDNLSLQIKEDFKKSGIYHLLAISGLHIAFFMALSSSALELFFRQIALRYKRDRLARIAGCIFLIFILLLYNFIVGQKASIERATLMAVIVYLAKEWKRDYDRKQILSISFICLLMLQPGFFMGAGFWLSFASVFAIIYVNDVLKSLIVFCWRKTCRKMAIVKNSLKNSNNFFKDIIITTISINIFIFPILAYIFKEFTLLALMTNPVAIPFFYILLLYLFIAAISGIIWPPAAIFIIKPAGILLDVFLKLAGKWKMLDKGILKIENFNIVYLVIYYLLVLTAILIVKKFFKSRHENIK